MMAARMAVVLAAAALPYLGGTPAGGQQPAADTVGGAVGAPLGESTPGTAPDSQRPGGTAPVPTAGRQQPQTDSVEIVEADGRTPAASAPGAPPAPDTLAASAGIAPDTVTVGDHFRVLVRVQAPEGASVVFPPFNLVEPVEAADSVRIRRDSTGAWTATYTLAAWITSDSLVAAIPFRVRNADGSTRDLRVRVELPHVRSVLPPDSTLHIPKPAKAVIPIAALAPTPRGWLIPAVLLGLVLVGIVWLALRRRISFAAAMIDPRSAALAELAEIEQEGLLARGEVYEYHVRTSRVLREYLALAAGVGEHLSSTEAVQAVRARAAEPAEVGALERLLRDADRVKFAGVPRGPGTGADETHGAAVARWIAAWPPHAESEREKAA